ncbi:hypothetical protein PIB30_027478 [Stylosanthes scabra]|uniref:Uncharacterized protein n=1 Tax=Stylosanthes scabra TaxID=79078 RepID=A0ABU6QAU7_9FABA|nr:hypothetical protein [Stylosanthes scabra]
MPLLSARRMLSVGTLFGPQKERHVNWYLEPAHLEKLAGQFGHHVDEIAEIIQHYAVSALVVIQDLLRVFVIRIACQNPDYASRLIRPVLSSINRHISESSSPLDTDAFKVLRLLDFLVSLLEHPFGKGLLLREGTLQIITKVLERCFVTVDADIRQTLDSSSSAKCNFNLFSCCLPAFKFIMLLIHSEASRHHPRRHDIKSFGKLSDVDCILILRYLLTGCEVLPVGKELLACLTAFKELASCTEGQMAIRASLSGIHSQGHELESRNDKVVTYNDVIEWKKCPPLLSCWMKLLRSINTKDDLSSGAVDAVYALSLGSLQFCIEGDSLNAERVAVLKYLFGLSDDLTRSADFPEDNINYILEFSTLLSSKVAMDDGLVTSHLQIPLYQVSELVKSLSLVLQRPASSTEVDDLVLPQNDALSFTETHQMLENSVEMIDDHLYNGGLADKFLWECPETLPDRLNQANLGTKRKLSSMDGPVRRARGESFQPDNSSQSTFSRGVSQSNVPSGPTRRDAFRQRKPNTSRPPSMHVDDYVARERNVDGVTNVIAVPRAGSTGGRPPSIHVDEFMARQRERQTPSATVVGEAVGHLKNASPVKPADGETSNKSKQLKTDLNDDLQELDIVFEVEESEHDDKLPFPQPDDDLPQAAPVIVEQSSPHSIVEETESDAVDSSQFSRMGTPLGSNVDENGQSEYSSKMSVSRPDILVRESSVSSDRKYVEQSDELKNAVPAKTSGGYDSSMAHGSGFPGSLYNNPSMSSMQLPVDSRMASQNFFMKNSPQRGGNASGSQGLYDQRFLPNQPPLPPMPPPPTISPVISHAPDSVPGQSSPFVNSPAGTQRPGAFQVQTDYSSPFNNGSTPTSSGPSVPIPDMKYSRTSVSSPGGPNRLAPPLPPTPPPFASSPYNLSSVKTSSPYGQTSIGSAEISQAANAPLGARSSPYPPNPLMLPLGFNRPGSMPLNPYGNSPSQQQSENQASILQGVSVPPASFPSMHAVSQLQPLQPPQLPRPPQPPQQLLRPPVQALQQLEQGMAVPTNVQVHQLQMLQQSQVSSMQAYYQNQQQEFPHALQQQHQQAEFTQQSRDAQAQQQLDPAMSLHEYFKSPEAIQSLLSDRDKLCQLLEQHPKLMQMLQERLGQL